MLENLSFSALDRTNLKPLFDQALAQVVESLKKDEDVKAARKITISLSFKTNEFGMLETEMKCHATTPPRSVKSVSEVQNNTIQIDAATNDVRSPSMFDDPGQKEGKVVDIGLAASGGGAPAAK